MVTLAFIPMMTAEFIAGQKKRLEDEQVRLQRDLGDIGRKDPKKPNHYETTYPESGSNSDDDNAMEIAEFTDDLKIGFSVISATSGARIRRSRTTTRRPTRNPVRTRMTTTRWKSRNSRTT